MSDNYQPGYGQYPVAPTPPPGYGYPTQPGYAYPPVYVYGAYPPYYGGAPFFDPQHAAARASEKKEIKRYALFAALAMLAYLVIQSVLAGFINVFRLTDAYYNDYNFSSGIEILYSIIAVALPFFLMYTLLHRKTSSSAFEGFAGIKRPLTAVMFIAAGFGACLLANYITSWLASLVESTGVTLPYDDSVPPMTATGIAVFFLKIAVVPALCEEFAIRGCVLQPLRKYGDVFAILVSSAAFAVLHANVVQIPFAFMAGAALGFVYCKTNSLWASAAVHFLNNAFSCFCTVLYELYDDKQVDNVLNYVSGGIILLAIASVAVLFFLKRIRTEKTATALTTGQKVGAYIFQPLFLGMSVFFIGYAIYSMILSNI